MYILLDTCQNPAILRGLYFIDIILNLAFTIIPIVLIIMIMVDFAKATISGDTDKAKKTTKIIPKRIIYAVLVFAVPWIVDVFMEFMNDLGFDSDYNVCLENARSGNFDYYDKLYEEEKKNDEEKNANKVQEQDSMSTSEKANSLTTAKLKKQIVSADSYTIGSPGNGGTSSEISGSGGVSSSEGTYDCSPSTTYYVTASNGLNCREGTGSNYNVSKTYSYCQSIRACFSDDGWYKTSDGCYVSGSYISSSNPCGGTSSNNSGNNGTSSNNSGNNGTSSEYSGGSGTSSGNAVNHLLGIPRYYQDDYGDVILIGDKTIKSSGCGFTSVSMVVSYLTGNQITPRQLIDGWSREYYVYDQGMSSSFPNAAAQHYNLGTVNKVYSIDDAYDALRKGQPVISGQKAGLFTGGQHLIVLSGYTSDGKILVNDPNKYNAINKEYNNRAFTKAEIAQSGDAYFIWPKK